MHITRSLIALSLVLVATTAQASPPDREGAYAYGSIGKSHGTWKLPAAEVAAGAKRKHSASGNSYSLGGGYRFGPFLAAEASIDNMYGRQFVGVTSRSFNVGGVALLPIGEHLELFGKVAVGRSQQTFTPRDETGLKRTRQNTFATTPSVGANVHLTDSLSLRAEYIIPMSVNKKVQQAAGVEKMRLNSWNVGMSYAF